MTLEKNNLHEIYICTNPSCGFRFPLSPTEKRLDHCPRCGEFLQLAEVPYHSFSVPMKQKAENHMDFVSILDNIRSAYNVGSVFRTSDGAGISRLFLTGITPTPENKRVGKTALGAEMTVPWEHDWSVLETAKRISAKGFLIVSLEGGSSALNIFDVLPAIKSENKPVALIVGNEVSGIDPEVVNISNYCVYIPMEGIKESLNVATAFGIAAYLIRYQGLNHE